MNINYKIPFYTNTEDNVQCVQASMKMVYEYFVPENKLSFDKWDSITAHKPGLWTWPMAGLMWFKKNNFEVIDIELFNYEIFANEGRAYMIEFFGKEVAEAQIKHSDIDQEMKITKDFIEKIKTDLRIPTINELRNLLKDGYVLICGVNAKALYGNERYSGHAIVIKGCTESMLIINDPGLPGHENLEVSDDIFYKAWAYPNENAANVMAFRLNK